MNPFAASRASSLHLAFFALRFGSCGGALASETGPRAHEARGSASGRTELDLETPFPDSERYGFGSRKMAAVPFSPRG
eukprot:5361183-Prymnesium_polylepis.1